MRVEVEAQKVDETFDAVTKDFRREASLPGFAKLKEDVVISGNTQRELRLQIGSIEESITVTDRLEPDSAPDPA
mgnify:CR=1 FL=1